MCGKPNGTGFEARHSSSAKLKRGTKEMVNRALICSNLKKTTDVVQATKCFENKKQRTCYYT